VIRPGKHGAVQAVKYQDQLVQLSEAHAALDPMQQLAYMQKTLQLTALVNRQMTAYVNASEEEYEEKEGAQIAAPISTDKTLYLSDAYRMPADHVLSGRGLLAGSSGSGKSNATAVIVEELAQLRVPLILADTEGEYDSLRDKRYLPNFYSVQGLTVNDAYQFGRYVLDEQLQVILNLKDYDTEEEAALVMVGLISGLRDWEEERENEVRIPCQFILEEAVTWLPQNIKESPLSEDALNALHRSFFNDLARKGRKRGLGILTVVQRIAEIDKRICNHSNYRLLLRQSLPADLQVYNRMGVKPEEAQVLENGQGYLYSSAEVKKLIQIRYRHSPHGANSPGLDALRRHQQGKNVVDGYRKPYEPFNTQVDNFQGLSELSSGTENPPLSWQVTRTTGTLETSMKALQKSDESIPQFSEEEERQVLQIARTQIATYGRVIRSKIPEAMDPKRNNAFYPVVKYLCDREGW